MKLSKLSTFVENFDMELHDGVSGSCVHCCFFVGFVVIIDIKDDPEATHDAEILTSL